MLRFAVAALACLVLAGPADARPKKARVAAQESSQCVYDNSGRVRCPAGFQRTQRHASASRGDPRPSKWCGWWMRRQLNVADRAGNRAIWWARYGTNAHRPAVGAIVVWRHHVGIITGKTASGWVVKSGNDGHAVRERERSLRGAVAFRWPNQWAGL